MRPHFMKYRNQESKIKKELENIDFVGGLKAWN